MDDTIDRLRRLGEARNRDVDPEPREVTLTDDEAAALVPLLVRGYNDIAPEPMVMRLGRVDRYGTFDVLRLWVHHELNDHSTEYPEVGQWFRVTLEPFTPDDEKES